jgi:hypothetical protein
LGVLSTTFRCKNHANMKNKWDYWNPNGFQKHMIRYFFKVIIVMNTTKTPKANIFNG